jgi:hypothetical protein
MDAIKPKSTFNRLRHDNKNKKNPNKKGVAADE